MNAKVKPIHACRRDVVIAALECWRTVVLHPTVNFVIMMLRKNDTIFWLLEEMAVGWRYYGMREIFMWRVVRSAKK
jgi:hypothetical protein